MTQPATEQHSALWAQLSQRERAFKVVDLPFRREDGEPIGKCAIRVLTQSEKQVALAQAKQYVSAEMTPRGKPPVPVSDDDLLLQNELSVQVLYRAVRDAENRNIPIFPTAKDLRDKATTDEIGVLMSSYITTTTELGPIVSEISDEEVDAWIEALTKGGRGTLDFFSREGVIDLAIGLARRNASLQTASASPGSQPEESTSPPKSASESDTAPADG